VSPRSAADLVVAVVHPDLLGTYGDGGNGIVLSRRAAWRGIGVELVQATSDRPLPTADLYCLGGGEDGPQVRAATTLREDGTLARAVAGGAVVLGVCAGFQLLGRSFPDRSGRPVEGLGLLDVTTAKGTGPRAVGELAAVPLPTGPLPAGVSAGGRPLPDLTGFENHGGVTTLGADATPLARVTAGVGNGDGSCTEGVWSERIVGTYLHGPVLARNPALADLLLGWATGTAPEPLDDTEELALRTERLAAVATGSRRTGRLRFTASRGR